MIPPDKEIYEVEKRIADRRQRVERAARESGRQALRALTSPWALAGAAVLGFLAAGGLQRRRYPHHEMHVDPSTKKAAKASTIASLGMAALTWFIKSQFGSPVQMAQFFLSKMKSGKETPSPAGDITSPRPRSARPRAPATIPR
jgi:hypothetical protein